MHPIHTWSSAASVLLSLALPPELTGQISFGAATNLPVGTRPDEAALGDVDRDGDLDLAVAVSSPVNGVAVWLNDGAGGFSLGANLSVASQSRSVALADLDRDGDLDLVVGADASVVVRLNNGNGTFGGSSSYPIGPNSRGLSIADLDRDRDLDVATASRDGNSVSVLRNDGPGAFAPALTLPVGAEPRNVVAADLNRDGLPDLATSNHDSRDLSVVINRGGGTFAPHVTYPVGSSVRPEWVTAGDTDGDGDLELVAAIGENPGRAAVFANNGSGVFSGPAHYSVGADPGAVIAVDFDGDRHLDLATANETGNSATILRNAGNGTFSLAATLPTGLYAEALAAGDLDGDGDNDLVVANRDGNSVSVLLNQTAGAATGPAMRLGGRPVLGTTVPLQNASPIERALDYVTLFSHATTPAIRLPDGRDLPLAFSPLLTLSFEPSVFGDGVGTLDGVGAAYVRFVIPNDQALRSVTVFGAFVVLDPRRPIGIGGISNPLAITLE